MSRYDSPNTTNLRLATAFDTPPTIRTLRTYAAALLDGLPDVTTVDLTEDTAFVSECVSSDRTPLIEFVDLTSSDSEEECPGAPIKAANRQAELDCAYSVCSRLAELIDDMREAKGSFGQIYELNSHPTKTLAYKRVCSLFHKLGRKYGFNVDNFTKDI